MFSLRRNQNGENFEKYVRLPVTAGEKYSHGEALVITDGKATKCGATAKPSHICGCDAAAGSRQEIPCFPIFDGYELETTVSASPSALKIGNKVTIDANGLQVTATTASGVAEIVDLLGASAAGDKVIVKF